MPFAFHRSLLGTHLLVILFGSLWASAASASTESELNALWRGAWTITEIGTWSDCGGNYTNNAVRSGRASSKGAYRFEPGELATVYKVDLKRKQVEVLLDLGEQILVERREGPFTLYDALECKVELIIPISPGRGARSAAQIDRMISKVLERHDDFAAAQASESWNRRLREPFPEGYEDTLAEYERWRIDQTNAEIAARIELHVEEAARLVDRLDGDPLYLEGFAAGVDRARDASLDRDCERLLTRSVASFVRSASGDDERAYREGYRDGQELVFYLETSRRLPACFAPVPVFDP